MYARCSILLAWLGCSNAPLTGTDASIGAASDGRGSLDAARRDAGADAMSGIDGTPTRMPCTSNFGTALPASGTFGRLDGYLVAVVAPGATNGCNDDASHVHLQIKMNGAIYDIAIDATNGQTQVDDVHTGTLDIAMPAGPAWSEGFHTGVAIDYPSLGIHASALPLSSKAQIVSTITADLATVNHISIFTTSYGGSGAHLVHRNGGSQDGVVVTEPLSTPSHLRLFSFTDQSF
ncbi:MAG TPA: hypothetical protein VFQ65_10955 [Kofleriaceae bacterium]|nr:hypothetical protein [Kofleriaceae bacterium]